MRNESEEERLDRNLVELLGELRVVLPGVQVLFAFLLAVPFQARFADVTTFQRDVYFATLCLALVASALLIAPSAYHRLNFRAGRKREIVMASNRLTIAGISVLGLALAGAMVLIADLLFGTAVTVVAGALAGVLLVVLWAVLPLWRRVGR